VAVSASGFASGFPLPAWPWRMPLEDLPGGADSPIVVEGPRPDQLGDPPYQLPAPLLRRGDTYPDAPAAWAS